MLANVERYVSMRTSSTDTKIRHPVTSAYIIQCSTPRTSPSVVRWRPTSARNTVHCVAAFSVMYIIVHVNGYPLPAHHVNTFTCEHTRAASPWKTFVLRRYRSS